jgi:oxygen-dependent protoporphyrinogen oxidase
MRLVIIGGGISGLSLAYLLRAGGGPSLEVTVFESEEKPGGKIWTDRSDGFLCEWGVNGFLDNKPRTLELAGRLSLDPLRSSDAARKRFVYTGKRLQQLPESPVAFLKSGLLSPAGKLRIFAEAVIPKGRKADESLADFARRRLGREAFEKLIDPMASGIYAGDPEDLSLRSCFPRINELEQSYGSLIRGMLKLRKKTGKATAGPGGTLTSFFDGMQAFTDALAASLGEALRVGSRAVALERTSGGYAVHLSDGLRVEADAAVLAIPAHQATDVLRDFDKALSMTLREIPYPPVTVVCTGFRAEKIRFPLDAFGFLVPKREGRKILGTLFDSSIFPNRAPEGRVLLRTMVGGARAASIAMLDDKKLLDTVMAEVGDITGISATPDFVRIFRHEKAIPQYTLGHQARLGRLDESVSRHRGLYLTGNAYRGISVNDCIENSYKLADRILQEVT